MPTETTWPKTWVDEQTFAEWLASREAEPARRDDCYLACACARGNEDAIQAFESNYFAEVERALAKMRLHDLTADELRQRLREKLFVGDGERPAAISTYAGKGEVAAWFRAVVSRMIYDHVSARREVPTDDAFFDAFSNHEEDAETAHLRTVYRAELRAAFGEAIERLSTVEKNLLRYAFVDGLGVDALGTIYKVHRATAARRLENARQCLAGHLRDILTERLRVSTSELASIVRLVLSGIDLTMARYLARS